MRLQAEAYFYFVFICFTIALSIYLALRIASWAKFDCTNLRPTAEGRGKRWLSLALHSIELERKHAGHLLPGGHLEEVSLCA